MSEPELNLFRNVGVGHSSGQLLEARARTDYGIQPGSQYALIEVASEPNLVDVGREDFGTVISLASIARDFKDVGPSLHPAPEDLLGGALRTVDIEHTLRESDDALLQFANTLMEGVTNDPFDGIYQDNMGIRAGDPSPRQKDAFVWDVTPVTHSVALTINAPGRYGSVCFVAGTRREAGNGKVGMSQIDDPRILLSIDGDNLARLQAIYEELYKEPDFALTDLQKESRRMVFNNQLVKYISLAARDNKRRSQQGGQLRARRL